VFRMSFDTIDKISAAQQAAARQQAVFSHQHQEPPIQPQFNDIFGKGDSTAPFDKNTTTPQSPLSRIPDETYIPGFMPSYWSGNFSRPTFEEQKGVKTPVLEFDWDLSMSQPTPRFFHEEPEKLLTENENPVPFFPAHSNDVPARPNRLMTKEDWKQRKGYITKCYIDENKNFKYIAESLKSEGLLVS
jgi:hypothetical protein